MKSERAEELVRRFGDVKVLVVGDLMLDEFVWGNVSRISPEAPVPVVEVTGQSYYAGGAANVARNLAEFTRGVTVMGLAGEDAEGERLRSLLEGGGVSARGIVGDPSRRTIVKTRVIARHQQVVRIDRESRMAPDELETRALIEKLEEIVPRVDAVILSDYAKGLLSAEVAEAACNLARRHTKILAVDPSPKNPVTWKGVTAIKPNLKEAYVAARMHEDEPVEAVGNALLEVWQAEMVLVTLGEHGMFLFRSGHEPYHTPSRAREVFDVSGAGDTAIAVFTLGLAAGAAPEEAAELANHAGGTVVGKLGTATVTPRELLEGIRETNGT